MYLLTITIKPDSNNLVEHENDEKKFTANLKVSMQGPHGFLSATNWPLLHVVYI